MHKNQYYTDMADERVDEYKEVNNMSSIDGIKVTEEKYDEFTIVEVDVLNENGSMAIEKEIGKYITIDMENIKFLEDKSLIIDKIKEKIESLMQDTNNSSVMIVGLGNEYVTADSLGTKVTNGIEITRHILKLSKDIINEEIREVSAIAPSVMGMTGIETTKIISAIAKEVRPEYIIVIDSLMSKSVKRIGASIQLSNTGIIPGSGISNHNNKIDEDLTGAKIISIGVPVVVDAATIATEALCKIAGKEAEEIYEEVSKVLNTSNFIVTPKDIDEQVDILSNIIYSSINLAM